MPTIRVLHAGPISVDDVMRIADSVSLHVASRLAIFASDERTLTDDVCDKFYLFASDVSREESEFVITTSRLTSREESERGADLAITVVSPEGEKQILLQAKVVEPRGGQIRDSWTRVKHQIELLLEYAGGSPWTTGEYCRSYLALYIPSSYMTDPTLKEGRGIADLASTWDSRHVLERGRNTIDVGLDDECPQVVVDDDPRASPVSFSPIAPSFAPRGLDYRLGVCAIDVANLIDFETGDWRQFPPVALYRGAIRLFPELTPPGRGFSRLLRELLLCHCGGHWEPYGYYPAFGGNTWSHEPVDHGIYHIPRNEIRLRYVGKDWDTVIRTLSERESK